MSGKLRRYGAQLAVDANCCRDSAPAGIACGHERVFTLARLPDGSSCAVTREWTTMNGDRHADWFVRTGATAPAFGYLRRSETGNEGLVDQTSASWNRFISWLRNIESLRNAA
jgi:hypothetical protein